MFRVKLNQKGISQFATPGRIERAARGDTRRGQVQSGVAIFDAFLSGLVSLSDGCEINSRRSVPAHGGRTRGSELHPEMRLRSRHSMIKSMCLHVFTPAESVGVQVDNRAKLGPSQAPFAGRRTGVPRASGGRSRNTRFPRRRRQAPRPCSFRTRLWPDRMAISGSPRTHRRPTASARSRPSGQVTVYPIPTSGSNPFGITVGPDGNLWFTEEFGDNIGRITPSGQITEFPIGGSGEFPERNHNGTGWKPLVHRVPDERDRQDDAVGSGDPVQVANQPVLPREHHDRSQWQPLVH